MEPGPVAKRALSLRLEATRLDVLDLFDSTKAVSAAWWPPCKGGPADIYIYIYVDLTHVVLAILPMILTT